MKTNPYRQLPPWTVQSSSYVLRDHWISVRADACKTDERMLIDPFYVLEYPDWVQIVAIDHTDRLILLEQYRHGWGTTSLELPTGGIESCDNNSISAARRELEEETGFTSDYWQHIATLTPNPANQTNRCHVILARGVTKDGICKDDPTERVHIFFPGRRSENIGVRWENHSSDARCCPGLGFDPYWALEFRANLNVMWT